LAYVVGDAVIMRPRPGGVFPETRFLEDAMSMSEISTAPSPTPRGRRLAQVHARDPRAEGVFWYSVVTTGVYCRPTCPSRKARPEHIRFHETLAEARRTGFRPCRRCRPEEPALYERQRALVEAACAQVSDARQTPTLKALAQAAGISASHFHRLFKRVTGVTPGRYFDSVRTKSSPPPWSTTRVVDIEGYGPGLGRLI
jgi:AraC family transcriptional regulator of adaptative response/methylated-DNA-[protein]-cysteine methyltransferase